MVSRDWLFAIPWTTAHQAPLSMGFPRKEYWSGLPFVSPGDLPDPGIEPVSPALQADSLPLSQLGSLLRGLTSLNDLASTHFPSTSLSFSYSGLLSVLKRWDSFLPQVLAEMTQTIHSECFIFSQVLLGLNPSHLLGLSLNAAWGFLSGSDGKRICLQYRRPGFDLWVGKTPWRSEWQPTQVFLPGQSHRQGSLAGYRPRSHKSWTRLRNALNAA